MNNPALNELASKKANKYNISNDNDWITPKYIIDYLEAFYEIKFDFDPCPLFADFDGIETDWGNFNFVNPPYDRTGKPAFVMKAYEES